MLQSMPRNSIRLRSVVSLATVALAAATLVGVPPTAQAAPDPTASLSAVAPQRAMSFTATAPRSVRTSETFRVTATLPRSYARAVAVVELRKERSWIPLRSATVSLRGSLRVSTQLSQPGTHQIRVRIPSSTRLALSQTMTITAKGVAPTSQSPVRMVAHFAALDAPPIQRIGPRADPPKDGLEVASEAASSALSVESLAKGLAKGAVEGVGSFGAEALLGLMFPGRSTATEEQIANLEAEVQQGFNNVYFDLQQLQQGITTVEAQNSQIFAESSLAACNSALASVKGNVDTIQSTFLNYQDVLTESWGEANLSYSGGPANATVMGNYIFGTGSNATPSFGPGINGVQVAVTDLEQAFTQSGPFNVINTCADAIAGYVIQQNTANVTAPSDQMPIGVLEAAYAELMQNLVGEYAAIINTGLALVGVGDFLAAATLVPPTVTTVPQFLTACQTLDVFSCPDIANEIQVGQDDVSEMWHAAGASWGQVTNGTLLTDLYATSADTVFTGGNNAWLPDITAFQAGDFGTGLADSTGEPVTSSESAGTPSHPEVMGTTGFADPQWGPLTFAPATSAAWNGIIRTSSYTQPYPNAQGTILAACGGPSLTNCSDPGSIADYLNGAGLTNLSQPFSDDVPVVFYTGENYEWNPNYSAISPGLGFMGNGEGDVWSVDSQGNTIVPNLTVASFLDTGMQPNRGVSAVVNDPATFSQATGTGTIGNLTLGDVFPFATNGNNPATDWIVSTVTMQNYSNGYNLVSIPCSAWSTGQYGEYGGNWTVMDWLSPGNGTTNNYGNGCGWTRYFPEGGAPETSGLTTQLTTSTTAMPGFYTQPVLKVGVEGNGSQPIIGKCTTSSQYSCSSTYAGGWDALPGFVLDIAGDPVTTQKQTQYLWPVVPTAPANLATVCPAVDEGSNVTNFSQGNSGIGLPQTCTTLFDEWLAVAASQDIGPVSIQVGAQTGQPGGGYIAPVTFFNSSSTNVTMAAGLTGADGISLAAPPSGAGVTACAPMSGVNDSAAGYNCTVTIPPGSTTMSVPLTFAIGATQGTLFVGAANQAQQFVAGTTAQVTPAPVVSNAIPFGVTGLSAVFEWPTITPSGGGTVTLGWNEPYSIGNISSYVVTATGPAGATPIDDTIPVSQVTVQANGQLTTEIDISQGGQWTFTVAAASSAGVGPADSLTTYVGDAPPLAPRNLAGRELVDGQVSLSWQPSVASPNVQFYTVRWWSGVSTTPPPSAAALVPGPDWVTSGAGASMVGAVNVTNPRYFVPPLPTTGPWTFQVTATNSMGTSTASTVMVNMQGFVPSRPISFAVEVNTAGTVNAEWTASPFGVPAPTSYTVGLYAPEVCSRDDSCSSQLLASETIAATVPRGPSGVFDLFTLGRDSKPGVYTVVVYATNALGDGASARSSILITQGFINRLTGSQDTIDTSKAKLPKLLAELTALECLRGLLTGSMCKVL